MSLFYPDKTHNGVTSLYYFAELLAGGSNTFSFFPQSIEQVCDYYPIESERLLYANLEDHSASLITLQEARNYCALKKLSVPPKMKVPDNIEALKQHVIQLELNLANLSKQLIIAENSQSEDEPVSAMRTVGALAMLLSKEMKHKYQDQKNKDTIKPALEPICDAIVTLIQNELNTESKYFASKTLQPTVRAGIAAFNEKLRNN